MGQDARLPEGYDDEAIEMGYKIRAQREAREGLTDERSRKRMISVTLTVEQWVLIVEAIDTAYGEHPTRLAVASAWVEIDEAIKRVTPLRKGGENT